MDELARLKQKCNKLIDIIKKLEEENKRLKVTTPSDTAKLIDNFTKLNDVYNYLKLHQKLVVRKAKFEDIDYTEFKKLTSEYFSNEDEFLDFMKFLKMFNFIETAYNRNSIITTLDGQRLRVVRFRLDTLNYFFKLGVRGYARNICK